jgi:hypothetical protein
MLSRDAGPALLYESCRLATYSQQHVGVLSVAIGTGRRRRTHPVADRLPELTDDEIELLRRLSSALQDQLSPASLTDAIKFPMSLPGLTTKALARPTIDRTTRALSRLTEHEVTLLRAKGRLGTFATSDCQALAPALQKIATVREAIKNEAARRARLEWLQLSTCLDKGTLIVGAYQSHAERFLASAGRLISEYFPWIDFHLDVEENRVRSDNSRGVVRERFNSGKRDFMLVPRASEQGHLVIVYTYSFRVVGTAAQLTALREEGFDVVQVARLRGEKLIVAPAGTSSRRRLRELFQDARLDTEDGSVELIEEKNPGSMRIRAETGEGLAIISDEYTSVGGSSRQFPRLALGYDGGRPIMHKVEMGLLRQSWATMPRHMAFDFVIEELVAREAVRERAAAQD